MRRYARRRVDGARVAGAPRLRPQARLTLLRSLPRARLRRRWGGSRPRHRRLRARADRGAPLLPVEEEGRLGDPAIRESFIERVFAMARWRAFLSRRPGARGSRGVSHGAEARGPGPQPAALRLARPARGRRRRRTARHETGRLRHVAHAGVVGPDDPRPADQRPRSTSPDSSSAGSSTTRAPSSPTASTTTGAGSFPWSCRSP